MDTFTSICRRICFVCPSWFKEGMCHWKYLLFFPARDEQVSWRLGPKSAACRTWRLPAIQVLSLVFSGWISIQPTSRFLNFSQICKRTAQQSGPKVKSSHNSSHVLLGEASSLCVKIEKYARVRTAASRHRIEVAPRPGPEKPRPRAGGCGAAGV